MMQRFLPLMLVLWLAFSSALNTEEVCPLDFTLIRLNDGTPDEESLRRHLEPNNNIPTIEVIRQTGDSVDFVVHNTTAFEGIVSPDHIFVKYQTDGYGTDACVLAEDLGPVDVASSASDVQTAHCIEDRYALVNIYARSATTSGPGRASIPICCQDPYQSGLPIESSNTVQYTYEIGCTASCDNPVPVTTLSPTESPTESPSSSPTESSVEFPTGEDQSFCASESSTSILARDQISASQVNGPHWGSRHSWAWPELNNKSCNQFQNGMGPGKNAWPCAVKQEKLKDRILRFNSSYMQFDFRFNQGTDGKGMKGVIQLVGDSANSSPTVRILPRGASGKACSRPPEGNWDNYPIRLVKSGRYYHHWYATNINCNGSSDDTRIEIKVTSDCMELHMVSNKGAADMSWLDIETNTPVVSSTNGYAAISYCVQCDSEIEDPLAANLSGCSIVQKQVPTDCCTLNPAGDRDGTKLCGSGWDYNICGKSKLITTPMNSDVTLDTKENYPIKADGHSFHINVPKGSGNQMNNQEVTAVVENKSDQWKKVKINFHIQRPRRITGVSGVLLSEGKPSGVHVQMSKNWHESRPVLYDSYWWTGIVHFRVPPGTQSVKLKIAYQYYEGLHTASHSQLSLLGWATNGLWEEVGLGSNGEAITYEPHGHHRRQMILDTRSWLTCAKDQSGCQGSPDSTQWTENQGGGDFLNAINKWGKYQYLVGDSVYHTMNGPRLTNATYAGVTQDGKISVSRTVSTWTADDFVRHLHSFRYEILEETAGDNYPRFSMYTLGGDNYNYVQFPRFAYGVGFDNAFDLSQGKGTVPVGDMIKGLNKFHYTDYYSVDAPVGCSNHEDSKSCWFAMLTNPSNNIHQRGNRGVVVRKFYGKLNGQPWPPPGEEVSAFTFNLIKSKNYGATQNTASLELGLPSSFMASVDAGQAKFQKGDFLSADIELLLPPRKTGDTFSRSVRLKNWLNKAGVNADYKEGWRIIAKEATKGDKIVTTVFEGELERKYHPRIKVDCSTSIARFNIEIPNDMPGILPITIGGVKTASISLDGYPNEKLWRYQNGVWKKFATGNAYQIEKDVNDNSYTYVYSLVMEFSSTSSGNRVWDVGNCEKFYFGKSPPSDVNPPC